MKNVFREFRQIKRLLNIIEQNKNLSEQEKKLAEKQTLQNFKNDFLTARARIKLI